MNNSVIRGCFKCIIAWSAYKSPNAYLLMKNKCYLNAFARLFSHENDSKMENIERNPFFHKYAEKIATLQRTSPDEFLARVEATQKKKGTCSTKKRGFTQVTTSGKPRLSSLLSHHKEKKLDSIMKTELIKDKTSAEISKIWEEYHLNKDKIVATIPDKIYSVIFENSVKFPTFLYPLPREQGFDFFVAQFSGHECHFTSLINYQAHKENAPECFTIVHYTEFQEDKGIVLMSGEYDKELLSGNDAVCLVNQLQLYYSSSDDSTKYRLLKTFNYNSDTFKHMDLIDELHIISLN